MAPKGAILRIRETVSPRADDLMRGETVRDKGENQYANDTLCN